MNTEFGRRFLKPWLLGPVPPNIRFEWSPLVYSAAGLPAGLSIDSGTGAISGTPTVVGSSSVTVSATAHGVTDSTTFTWVVQSAAVVSGDPVPGTVGVEYSFGFTTGGDPAPVLTLVEGVWPAGLSLSTTGVLSGVPTQAGVFPVTVQAANGAGNPGTHETSVTIAPGEVDLSGSGSSITTDVTEAVADGSSVVTATVTLRDVHGNPTGDGGEAVDIDSDLGTVVGTTRVGDGTFTATLTSTETGTATLSFTVDGQPGANTASVELTPADVRVWVTRAEVRAGEVQGVWGTGFVAGERVRVVMASDPVVVGEALADDAGSAYLEFTVPPVEAGAHTLTSTGTGSGRSGAAGFTVLPDVTDPGTDPGPGTDAGDDGTGDGGTSAGSGGTSTGTGSSGGSSGVLAATGAGAAGALAPLAGVTLLTGGALLAARHRRTPSR